VVRGSAIEQSSVLCVLEVELCDNGIEVHDNGGELGMVSPKLERDFVAQACEGLGQEGSGARRRSVRGSQACLCCRSIGVGADLQEITAPVVDGGEERVLEREGLGQKQQRQRSCQEEDRTGHGACCPVSLKWHSRHSLPNKLGPSTQDPRLTTSSFLAFDHRFS